MSRPRGESGGGGTDALRTPHARPGATIIGGTVDVSEDAFERVFETARALGEETRFRIYRALCLSPNPVSVSDLAETFSLHPNAIRQHLTRLEQAGLVISLSHREGGAGRPRRLYHASPEPLQLNGSRRSVNALLTMISEALDALPADHAQMVAFGRAWGRAWGRRRRRETGAPRSRRRRVELLAGELAEWGWEPTTRQDNGQLRLETGRCLFEGSQAGEDGRCCALEEGLLVGLAEGILNGRATLAVEGCRLHLSV